MKVSELTADQKRYLSRFVCWLCEARLDKDICFACGGNCPQEVMDKRRADCLAKRRPYRKRG